jgi:hypothetical protein
MERESTKGYKPVRNWFQRECLALFQIPIWVKRCCVYFKGQKSLEPPEDRNIWCCDSTILGAFAPVELVRRIVPGTAQRDLL